MVPPKRDPRPPQFAIAPSTRHAHTGTRLRFKPALHASTPLSKQLVALPHRLPRLHRPQSRHRIRSGSHHARQPYLINEVPRPPPIQYAHLPRLVSHPAYLVPILHIVREINAIVLQQTPATLNHCLQPLVFAVFWLLDRKCTKQTHHPLHSYGTADINPSISLALSLWRCIQA